MDVYRSNVNERDPVEVVTMMQMLDSKVPQHCYSRNSAGDLRDDERDGVRGVGMKAEALEADERAEQSKWLKYRCIAVFR